MNNTVKRSVSGTVFLAVMVCGLLLNAYLFAALFLALMCGMMAEFFGMTLGKEYRLPAVLAVIAGITLFVTLFLHCSSGLSARYAAFTILPMLLLMGVSLFVGNKDTFMKISHIYCGILYIAVPVACSNMLVFGNQTFSGLLLLCFFVIIWMSDVGAFVFGISLGQKYGGKMCPEISPKKSWIGFWGGMLSSVLSAFVINRTGLMAYPLVHCLALAALMHVAGVFGDLFESQWKRCFDLKDSGSLIPGHGGLLDRFDSALMAIPAGALYLLFTGLL